MRIFNGLIPTRVVPRRFIDIKYCLSIKLETLTLSESTLKNGAWLIRGEQKIEAKQEDLAHAIGANLVRLTKKHKRFLVAVVEETAKLTSLKEGEFAAYPLKGQLRLFIPKSYIEKLNGPERVIILPILWRGKVFMAEISLERMGLLGRLGF